MGKVAASDAALGDQFGYASSISGNLAIIGARLDDHVAVNAGAAYIFRFDQTSRTWTEQAKLVSSDAATNDEFGNAVSIYSTGTGSGDIAIVGARFDDDHGSESGSAYIFRYDGTAWAQVAKLTASDGALADRFGFAVGISGDWAIVSARDDDSPTTNCGSAYIFRYNGTSWAQHTKLVASDRASNDQFGQSVSIAQTEAGSAAVALIGAWRDDSPLTDAGSAYIFRYSTTTLAWAQGAKITAPDAAASDNFGWSVSIAAPATGEKAAISARSDDDAGSDSGSVYVFRHVGTAWNQDAKILGGDTTAGDQFGYSVSMSPSGDNVLAGAWQNDALGLDSGAAYLFRYNAELANWAQVSKLTANDAAEGDVFGASVAIDGDRAVVGGYQNDDVDIDSGTAYFYAGMNGVDANGNGIADGCEVEPDEPDYDINDDGLVNHIDLLLVIQAWGVCPAQPATCAADVNMDGMVNVHDLLGVIANWAPGNGGGGNDDEDDHQCGADNDDDDDDDDKPKKKSKKPKKKSKKGRR